MDDPKFVPMGDAVAQFRKRLESPKGGGLISTGFSVHDQVLGHLRRAETMFVGARPGVGKSAFLLAMALNQLKNGLDVAFFSLEMPIEVIMARLVSIETGIRLLDILEQRIDEHEMKRILGCLPRLECA
jgi:replicative DNA helicase